MTFSDFIARQCGKPEGLFGRLVMGRMLDRVNRQGNQLVFDRLQLESSDLALEIGFGGGNLMFRVAAALDDGYIDGVELSMPMLEQARARTLKQKLHAPRNLYPASVDSLPCETGIYNCVYSVNTIYFWPDLVTGLTEIFRVVKPGGRLVLGFGSDTKLRESGYETRGFMLYSREQIIKACASVGFIRGECVDIQRKSRGHFYAYRGFKVK